MNFEELLEKKCKKVNSDLYSKWVVLKEQIVANLETINNIFPHYSRHDESHSIAILKLIFDMLGSKNVESLSISNILVLLLCTYSHDLGMSSDNTDFESSIESSDFLELIKKIQVDKSNPLFMYASIFRIDGNKLTYNETNLDGISFCAPKYLLAEYYRNSHGERSKEIVQKEKSFISQLFSPRIVSAVGRICESHTKNFSYVMSLPEVENGLCDDKYNPRFIACLLRLGDLLDVDSDRFSEALWNTLPSIPYDSECHKKKHESIKHFYVGPDKIEMGAECNDYAVVDILQKLSDMLYKEVSDQKNNWANIVPQQCSFEPPVVSKFDIGCNGVSLLNGKIPAFTINTDKAWELIQGSGFYENRFSCIRELIQNAIDATMIKVFLKHKKENLCYEQYKELFKSEKIEIFLSKVEDTEYIDKETIRWRLCIKDSGIGMNQKDLSYLIEAVSSYKNEERQKIINDMPEFLKPSGTFGLGFQSVYMLSDCVELVTKKIDSNELLTLIAPDPRKDAKKEMLFKRSLADVGLECGTSITFDFDIKKLPVVSDGAFERFSFDFVVEDSVSDEMRDIFLTINQIAKLSPIPIIFHHDDKSELCPQILDNQLKTVYFPDYGFELILPDGNGDIIGTILYRNQKVNDFKHNIGTRYKLHDNIFSPMFFPFSINILSGNAKDILKINRDEFQDNEIVATLLKNRILAGRKYLIENYESLTDDEKLSASLYVNYYDGDEKEDRSAEIFTLWERRLCFTDKKSASYKKIIDTDKDVYLRFEEEGEFEMTCVINRDKVLLRTASSALYSELSCFIVKKLFESGRECSLVSCSSNYNYVYVFKKISTKDKNNYILDYSSYFNMFLDNIRGFDRRDMPCNKKYKALEIKHPDNFYKTDKTFEIFDDVFDYKYPVMICPYFRMWNNGSEYLILKEHEVEKVCQKTYELRVDKSVTKEDIKRTMDQFLADTRSAVTAANKAYHERIGEL